MSRIAILGGGGFVGGHLAARLVSDGHRVTVLTRYAARRRALLVLPTLNLVETDVYDPVALARVFAGADAVVNLVGILNERGHSGNGFERAHVTLTEGVIDACRRTGVKRLLHMSALKADPTGPSYYLRTKGRAAVLALAAKDLDVTVFEPSVIFGPGDSFLNRFAELIRLLPLAFPLACPETRFAPVYVGDVAEAFTVSLDEHRSFGRRYSLCGPRVYTLREILRYTAALAGLRRLILGLPRWASWMQAATLEWVPGKPFSLDNLRSLSVDSVCDENGLGALEIEPTPLEAVAPGYIGRADSRGQYDRYRRGHD